MPGGRRLGAGRKLVNIDLVELEKLCAIQCTDEEIAAWLGVSTRTIQSRKKQPEFSEAMTRGKAKGRISIRRWQMKLLEGGNAAIAIWLGKVLLGQRDVTPVEVTGRNGEPVQFSLESLDALITTARKRKKSPSGL
jgi:hypothetical protein